MIRCEACRRTISIINMNCVTPIVPIDYYNTAQNLNCDILYTCVLIHHRQKETGCIWYPYLLIKSWMEQNKTIVVDCKTIAIDPNLQEEIFKINSHVTSSIAKFLYYFFWILSKLHTNLCM